MSVVPCSKRLILIGKDRARPRGTMDYPLFAQGFIYYCQIPSSTFFSGDFRSLEGAGDKDSKVGKLGMGRTIKTWAPTRFNKG